MHVHDAFDIDTPATRDPVLARWRRIVLQFCRRRPLGAAGAAIIVLMILCAIAAPAITPYHPLETDFAAQLTPPNAQHWLGTDAFGRDLLSRLIYGSRTALLVGFAAALLGASLGAIIGVASAYFGGRIDLIIQVAEPTPAWGLMRRGAAAEFAESAPWMAIFPGLAISLGGFAFNLFGDSLRDALDPKLRTL